MTKKINLDELRKRSSLKLKTVKKYTLDESLSYYTKYYKPLVCTMVRKIDGVKVYTYQREDTGELVQVKSSSMMFFKGVFKTEKGIVAQYGHVNPEEIYEEIIVADKVYQHCDKFIDRIFISISLKKQGRRM